MISLVYRPTLSLNCFSINRIRNAVNADYIRPIMDDAQ